MGLIALRFPKWVDGRAYSQARVLRSRYRFRGEIRAAGHVLADQQQFLLQCGFDSFQIDDPRLLSSWRKAEVPERVAAEAPLDPRPKARRAFAPGPTVPAR